jgi:hypothetical protein
MSMSDLLPRGADRYLEDGFVAARMRLPARTMRQLHLERGATVVELARVERETLVTEAKVSAMSRVGATAMQEVGYLSKVADTLKQHEAAALRIQEIVDIAGSSMAAIVMRAGMKWSH